MQKITVKELQNIAKQRGIRGYSRKCKKDLADFIIINSADPVHEIRESNSALKGFTKRYTMDGSEGIDAMSFFNDIQPQVTDLLSKNTQTKVNMILTCIMERVDIATGEVQAVNAPFLSRTQIILDATDVTELYKTAIDKIMESIAAFQMRGSNWRFKRVVKLDINTAVYKPLKGNSHIPLPEKLAKKRAIINMKNKDNECFKWCITRALNPVANHEEKIDKNLRKQSEELDWSDIYFPVSLSDIDKFERRNGDIKVNVFSYDKGKIYPLRNTAQENAIDLLLISDGEKKHYCWIKNFNRLMARHTKYSRHSMHYCKRCLNSFTSCDALSNHKMYCNQQDAVRVELPKHTTILKFKNHNRSMRVPFVVYADFECFIRPIDTCEPNPENSYTKQYQKHTPASFSYYIKCFDDKIYSQKPVTYTAKSEGDDVAEIFVKMLEIDIKAIYQRFDQPEKMVFGNEDEEEYEKATDCWICHGKFNENDKKVRDHCHFTGKFRGAAHNSCNLKYKKPKFIPVVFHNLSGYDSHLFIKNLGATAGNINCIPHNEEKYISFTKDIQIGTYINKNMEEKPITKQLRFIDSFKFMSSSLHKLVSNNTACGKCDTCKPGDCIKRSVEKGKIVYHNTIGPCRKCINCHLKGKPCQTPTDTNLKIIKSFYKDEGERLDPELYKRTPLNGINNLNITLREKIDRRKLEYILAHTDDFDLGSRMIKGRKVDKDGQITLLKNYLIKTNSHGEQLMEYYQRNGFGRYWTSSNLGLQNMSRKIRHTLCSDYMYDIDMKNAHPTFLSWYCHENGISCEGLDSYIAHRDEYIADYMKQYDMSRDDVKAHLLAVINGRVVGLDPDCPEWYRKFSMCVQNIMRKIVKICPEYHALAKKSKGNRGSTYNIKGTTVNYIMCQLENQALMTAFDYLIEHNIEVGSLVFDGLMIYKDNVSPARLEEILVGLSERIKDVMGCHITFTNKVMDEGYDIPVSTFPPRKGDLNLLLKKGVYPYEYMDSFKRLDETKLPPMGAFYSKLSGEGISNENYEHAQKVWKEFGCNTMRDYLKLYNESDVLQLADVYENFRDICMKNYDLDPAWYFTSPGLAWDAALKHTGIELELLSDPDMLLMVKRGIRGGMSIISRRHAKANNKYMGVKYNKNEKTKYITYLDANNLYGWAMRKPLPTGEFKWMNENELDSWKNMPGGYGCILEVDLEYPHRLHDLHNEYPLAPENLTPKDCKVEKLIPNLHDKRNYVVHYETLQLYENLGLKVTRVHSGIKFRESTWLKKYIDLNTKLRTEANSEFEKDFFKLMNNSVFGKTMENMDKRVDIRLVCDEEKATKLVAKPNYDRTTIFDENLIAIHMKKTKVYYDKPIYLGLSILDLSKTLMYDFHYNYIKSKYGDKAKLLFTDTDSLMYEIETDDVYADIADDVESKFDTSEYPTGLPVKTGVNKKVIGMFKDEACGQQIEEFVGLRAKLYSYVMTDKEHKKCKGIKKNVVEKTITHSDYKKCLFSKIEQQRKTPVIRSYKHVVYTEEINKTALSADDDKRVIMEDGVSTLAHGHYKLAQSTYHVNRASHRKGE